ncbi:MAG: acyltransferase, partial [Ornithinimicrobium sp.]
MSGNVKHAPTALRGDIEGLRAIAVGMVLLYHARVPGISGGFAGVDVFFVISGFLITSLLVREVQRSGSISIPRFYARRARRLLPAATVVLVATGVVGYLVFPALSRAQLGSDILTSTFYVVNWSLAARSVDYLAEDATPSALQHYWSLSVEEQFYVFWPLLMIAAVILAKRRSGSPFRYMGLSLAAITFASLAWSIIQTQQNPSTAYFVTTTRVWELGFGALLAFAVVWLGGLPRAAAEILAAAGIVALVVATFAITAETPWPGSAALVPVLGTTAVIAAGCANPSTITGRLLGVRPMRFIGGISYSLYLWHWPLLVFMDELRPGTGLRGRLAVLGLAVALAYASKIFIEDPIRFNASLAKKPAKALLTGGVAMATSTAIGVAAIASAPTLQTELPEWAVGARALMVDPTSADPEQRADIDAALPSSGQVYPDPELAPEDVPELYADDCQVDVETSEALSCDYGDTSSDTVIAVVGDSKVGQWLP